MPIKIKISHKHYEKYAALAKKYYVSFAECENIFGWTKDEIMDSLEHDPHLNFIWPGHWNFLAYSFLAYNRNTGLSLPEVVCMYKHLVTFEFAGCVPEFED